VSRRAAVAVAVAVVLIGGRLLVSRGHSVAAAHSRPEPAASPAPEVTLPGPAAKLPEVVHEASAARRPAAAESVDGVADIDPHKVHDYE
jgi:hypothetical protein